MIVRMVRKSFQQEKLHWRR